MIHSILVVLGCTIFYWLWACAFDFLVDRHKRKRHFGRLYSSDELLKEAGPLHAAKDR